MDYCLFFERRKVKRKRNSNKSYDAILFGYNRIGFSILNALKRIHKNYLVVDFNPDTINGLSKMRIPALYGDAYDSDFLDNLPIEKMKIAISTIPDFETNELLIKNIRKVNPKAIIIVRTHKIADALELYKKGASYVLTPHFLGGEYVSKMIRHEKLNTKGYKDEREKHMKVLQKVIRRGMKHPEVEKN